MMMESFGFGKVSVDYVAETEEVTGSRAGAVRLRRVDDPAGAIGALAGIGAATASALPA